MTEIVKFNLIIILLSVFIVAMNVDAYVPCRRNADCLGEKCLPPKRYWCRIITEPYEDFPMGRCDCI
ncbi:Nodule Cysteine-Rich (NCR) secreted peptide [Medicago truncatula]|uniref:Nodule Cysteine-Rich (NCR) secreted peptide n=2 Tax=Medicago truncatula TaxID=3880 RepID=A0A072VH74_MEDTR|nr:Nodule Cysteine-Rich (NCR) secreted peptide [Medicago truncatula]